MNAQLITDNVITDDDDDKIVVASQPVEDVNLGEDGPELSDDDKVLVKYGYDPAKYRVNANDAIVNLSNGRIVKKLPGKNWITPETARDYHKMRESKRIRIAAEAMQAETGTRSLHESAVILTRAQVKLSMTGTGVAAVRSFENIMSMSGVWTKQTAAGAKDGDKPALTITADGLDSLRAILDGIREIRSLTSPD